GSHRFGPLSASRTHAGACALETPPVGNLTLPRRIWLWGPHRPRWIAEALLGDDTARCGASRAGLLPCAGEHESTRESLAALRRPTPQGGREPSARPEPRRADIHRERGPHPPRRGGCV